MSAPHRPFAERLPRRRRKSAWLLAVAGPLGITFLQWAVGTDVVPPAAVLLVTLLVVVVVALLGGVGPALASVAVGLAAQEVIFEFPYGSLNDHEPIQATV